MNIPQNFEIDVVSDVRFEELLVEVSYRKQRLFQLNRENGPSAVEIEFLSDLRVLPDDVEMKFTLEEFEAVLALAKDVLLEGTT